MRKTGILMAVSSLPSRTGVGELGKEAYRFIELLKENSVKIWQILPLNPVGYGNSPYQPYSSCAGDELYISLDMLYEDGLLSELPPSFNEHAKSVDYDAVRVFKETYLREAFRNFCEKEWLQEEDYQEFASQDWVYEYGVFRALKVANGGICWNEWRQEDKDWPAKRTELAEEIELEAQYHMFLQYLFYTQWMQVKDAANESGIEIMGDVPFYVGVDSVDVWAGKDNFLLDTDGRPVFIAGVPPDYFSATGQRWGNPIYDWEYMKEQNYQFWVDRIGYSSRLFDIIRIDHFRAFDTFWKIPATCPTAVEGEWIEAPGYEVIDTLIEKIPGLNLVAEDLGDLRPEVLELKDHYHLKGMKVQVFSIETKGKFAYDSFHDVENMIIYTGTHDNDTLMEWYQGLTTAAKRKVRRFLKREGFKQGSVKDRLLAYTLACKAEYAVIPMVDIIGQGKEGHMNTPGTVGSPNWEWRMPDFAEAEKELKVYRKLIINR
ncbi:4-alpha-glucanotransferase [Clostridium sp. AF19-22AC]|jgi:4-alpha-glucanotransferase|uniref:4-alpha-glucanotransferase n=1 Tax=Faecalicatena orotica TaxID=1544 RepID=A0A2Y9B9N0_9FIRM|nr:MULTISPECIES: 4-alpha-glucanotransferase [Clostridia]PWJ32387.1 4-alpha-glucanotransferase [Faecalicatena orotica]RHR25629.1 4-alpha-glucanotransferase [Clostridium sp. AF19-22AC]SSA54221.1 4-alpha-glucanotransferase [Faecalicatena orotica]